MRSLYIQIQKRKTLPVLSPAPIPDPNKDTGIITLIRNPKTSQILSIVQLIPIRGKEYHGPQADIWVRNGERGGEEYISLIDDVWDIWST